MLPVAVHVPGVCVVAIAADIPVTDLLNAAKVSRTPIEQRTKPIKTRGLKKADREKELFFMKGFPLGLQITFYGITRVSLVSMLSEASYSRMG